MAFKTPSTALGVPPLVELFTRGRVSVVAFMVCEGGGECPLGVGQQVVGCRL